MAVAAGGPAPSAAAPPPEERAAEHGIRVVTYNVGDGAARKKRADLRRLMALRPAVIGLQEVADRVALIRALAPKHGYRSLIGAEGDGRQRIALLVRKKGVKVLDHGLRKISDRTSVHPATPGTGDGDQVSAKYVHWVRLRVDGLRWTVGAVHLVPSASKYKKNRRLHGRQVAECAAWFRGVKVEPLLMGDFNATPRSGLVDDLREVARPWSKPSFEKGDRPIDMLWTRKDARGKVRALGVDPDPDYSSDHRPLRLDARVTR